MFHRDELLRLIDSSSANLRGMIYLALNLGFSAADCCELPVLAFDIEAGRLEWRHPQTNTVRRGWLWPETCTALRPLIAQHEASTPGTAAGYVFVTEVKHERWAVPSVKVLFHKLQHQARVSAPGSGFSGLSLVFRTIAKTADDAAAVHRILGTRPKYPTEEPPETADDERLKRVAATVRSWLVDGQTATASPKAVLPTSDAQTGEIPLLRVLEDYLLYRKVASNTEMNYRRTLTLFSHWLKRPATINDLQDRQVSEWIASLEQKYEPRGVVNQRTNLLCLWRFAADEYAVRIPGKVRKAKTPSPCPVSWTIDEVQRLLQRCQILTGTFRKTGAARSVFCSALVRFAYESGLRRSDIVRITRDQIRPDGTIVLRQHKTGHTHWPRIRAETLLLLEQLPGKRPLALPYANPSDFYKYWRTEVIAPANVRPGALQQLRRTGATHVAKEAGRDAARRFLGHRTEGMVRHYVDESIAMENTYQPPALQTTSTD